MKKLLLQLDTDSIPSSFDSVVAYDGGIDHLMTYAGMTPDNVEGTVHGAIFTRGGANKKYTAIFVGGSNLAEGEALFATIQKTFFGNFRVSLMLDSNGCNTTAAAAVARITSGGSIAGKKAVVLAGTGPLGQRAGVLLAKEGAEVTLTSRRQDRADAACAAMNERFGVNLAGQQVADEAATQAMLEGAQIVLATGTPGIKLLPEGLWQNHPTLEILADVNTVPPTGIEGIKMLDKGKERHGKTCFGGLGIGGLKMKTHRAAIAQLFEANDQVFDAEAIYELAKELR
ncbi:NADP-dependent methylenetetrahydromethanopterin/methylenetetrahydrofolate dehydrogenase [Anaerolineales bacterium HSG25]|nr:NADP-dependent methylenetetrahydromethanopterin/methylenetetrahydrofolate dehydrogenase [Anaerolineales bacterium HSG25]